MQLIRRGRPAVVLVTEQFAELARRIINAGQAPDSSMVLIPGNPEFVTKEELMMLADRALVQIVEKLTGVNSA